MLSYCSPSDNPPKLSPGWNKVALLTFVRNSPCSCPFSVSLHPPLAALNSEPRKRWRLIVRFTSLHIKPALKGEVANVVSRRGYKAAYSSLFITTPQSRLAPCQLPVRGAFWCGINSEYSAVPLRGAIVSMGLRGGAGGPKGRNRNLPWPPCKKGYKETPFSFVYLNPSVNS